MATFALGFLVWARPSKVILLIWILCAIERMALATSLAICLSCLAAVAMAYQIIRVSEVSWKLSGSCLLATLGPVFLVVVSFKSKQEIIFVFQKA